MDKQKLAPVVPLCNDYQVNIKVSDNLSFMRSIPDSSIKLIVTSPPYNIGKKYEKGLL